MKADCWNIKDLNKPLKQKCVHVMLLKHDLDIFCLAEIKMDLVMIDKFMGFIARV